MDRLTHFQFFALDETDSSNLCACGEAYEKSGCCHDLEVHASNEEQGIGITALSLTKLQFNGKVIYFCNLFRFEPKPSQSLFIQNLWVKSLAPPLWYASWEITKLLI